MTEICKYVDVCISNEEDAKDVFGIEAENTDITGGINATNVRDYLVCDKILACGGSWMVKGDLINAGDFETIEKLTKEAAQIVKEIRG